MPDEKQPELEDLGWGNGWGKENTPAIVARCLDLKHHPPNRRIRQDSEVFEVKCEKCGYRYRYHAGD